MNTMDQIASKKYDHLTGLYNRKAGLQKLTDILKKDEYVTSKLIVVLTDINDVNEINKKLGHDAGDQAIYKIAHAFQDCLCENDFAIRLSGDEFLLVFLKTNQREVDMRLEKTSIALAQEKSVCDLSYCYGLLEVDVEEYGHVQRIIMELDNRMSHYKRRYHMKKARRLNKQDQFSSVDNFVYEEEYLLDALLRSTDDYIYVCNMRDHPGTFCYSKSMVEEFNLPGEIVENAAQVWGSKIHEADQRLFLQSNQEIADGVCDEHNVEYRAINKEGKWVWLRCRGQVVRDERGEPILFAGFITCLNRKNKVDHLTGLFNKFEFEDTVNQMIKKEHTEPFSVLVLDMDEFSSINKLYDTRFGDKILELTAQKIMSILPEDAKVFRNEGDEFIVVLRDDKSKKEVTNFYNKLQKALGHQQEYEGKKYHSTISAGCAKFPDDAIEYMTLTKSASCALEHSKKAGRNRLTFFEKGMLSEEMLHLDMSEQLRYSVEHDFEGFRLQFQPQVKAQEGKIVGVEALARWQCDMYGNVPPLTFIPLLEKSGMIIPVGKWIFEEAVKYCKQWVRLIPSFCVSINLSYLQLNDTDFVKYMHKIVNKYEIDAKNIVVEMTESRIMATESIRENFKKIRKLGIRIAMDDFGTGYSSLGALKNAPADIVKIDKMFMANILDSEFDTTFITFIVRLCHDVGIHVLLEGVETNEEYEKVKPLGLDYIQGYFFGKPMEVEKVTRLLQ